MKNIEYSRTNYTIISNNERFLYAKAAATANAWFEQYENAFLKGQLGENKCVPQWLCQNKVL